MILREYQIDSKYNDKQRKKRKKERKKKLDNNVYVNKEKLI
jgi:hypothetical protein